MGQHGEREEHLLMLTAHLPADYVTTVKPIAERQVTPANALMADELLADVAN